MAYCFELDEPLRKAVRRISIEQIDNAARDLTTADDPHTAIHETRKDFKRLRALLHLVRPALSDKVFARENRRFRDIGRSLSGARDVHVMLETLAKLQPLHEAHTKSKITGTLKSSLKDRRAALENTISANAHPKTLKALATARKVFQRLPLKRTDLSVIEEGLQHCYGQGRGNMKKAYKHLDSAHFHNWRKLVQRHWRHMKLLSATWPEMCDARILCAKQLSDVLGIHNDIDVLENFVRREKTDLLGKADIGDFLEICSAQKTRLRLGAQPLGERLYAERAGQFARRMTCYWRTGSTLQAMSNVIELHPLDRSALAKV